MKGLVIRNTGSHYTVHTDSGADFDCKVKGNFRLRGIRSTNPVAVGDVVVFDDGWITDIDDRRNYIIRKASNLSKQSHILAANVDECLLMVTVNYPETSTTFIDRFLATAEAYRIPVRIVINKADRYDEAEQRIAHLLADLYQSLGYPCHLLSLKEEPETADGSQPALSELAATLTGKTILLSGHSGVGKSTLLNALIPGTSQRTAEISDAHNTGMHTTTFSEMFPMPGGGWLIDTPGVKGFGTFDMEREEVGHYFREIFRFSAQCHYGNCTHTHEPGCAVLDALDKQLIAPSRYNSYLSMLDDKEEAKYR